MNPKKYVARRVRALVDSSVALRFNALDLALQRIESRLSTVEATLASPVHLDASALHRDVEECIDELRFQHEVLLTILSGTGHTAQSSTT